MKCVVLAAGYATRLYPLTKNFPKPLLEVNGKTILDRLVCDVESTGAADGYIIISNHRYAGHFRKWAEGKPFAVTVVDDGTESNETRLGAVKDLQFAIDTLGLRDDLLVIAGDNLLDFSLSSFISFAREKGTSCSMRTLEPDREKLTRCGISEVDGDGRLVSLEEKPAHPKSSWITPPFYYYTAEDAARIKEALADGCGTDAPGSLLSWMCVHTTVYSMEMPGRRYDVGDLASYEEVRRIYGEKGDHQ